ncbi:putative glycolipid-binding domain-containing protein [Arenibacterium sp. CAU 1754]
MTKGAIIATAHWRRLDHDGTDRCTLSHADHGWLLSGQAAWQQAGGANLSYAIRCDETWAALSADVAGTCAGNDIGLRLIHTPQGWEMNDRLQPGTGPCVDLDLSFTPATNLLPLRRCPVDRPITLSAAWLVPDLSALHPMNQTYSRCDASHVDYASDNFSARLTVHETGFVTNYPDLWKGWVDA